MNPRRCLQIADRIDVQLQAKLARGIDLGRMLSDPLYARDVLLVCDAHRGEELATLAREFREAMAEAPDASEASDASEAPPESRPASAWSRATSDFMSSLFDVFRPSQPTSSTLPPADPAAQAELQRRAQAWYSPTRWRR